MTATLCNTLQHTATHCNTLQHIANQGVLKGLQEQGGSGGHQMEDSRVKWLRNVARAAFNAHLRTLRC